MNTASTQPQRLGEMSRSACILVPAMEMQMRSRYVMTDSPISRPNRR